MPKQPQQRERLIQQQVPGGRRKTNSTKLTPWQRPTVAKKPGEKIQASLHPCGEKTRTPPPEHSPQDWEGHSFLRSGGQTTEDCEKKAHATTAKPAPPTDPHHWPSKNANGETTSRHTPLGKGQNQPTGSPSASRWRRALTEKQNPMSPDRAGKAKQLPRRPPKLHHSSENTRKRRRSQGNLIKKGQPIRDRSTQRRTEEANTVTTDNCAYPEKPQNAAIKPAKNHRKQKTQRLKRRSNTPPL